MSKEKLGAWYKDVQVSALKLISSIISSSCLLTSSFLTTLCTKDTFLMLLENMTDNDQIEKVSSTEILTGLVKNSGICLPTCHDLELMLALVERDNFTLIADVLLGAIDKKKSYDEEVLALRFEEVCLRNETQQSQAELFEALMSPDFTHSMVSSFLPPATCEDTFSPLILALLENHSNNNIFVESFFRRLVFLFQDVDVFS